MSVYLVVVVSCGDPGIPDYTFQVTGTSTCRNYIAFLIYKHIVCLSFCSHQLWRPWYPS